MHMYLQISLIYLFLLYLRAVAKTAGTCHSPLEEWQVTWQSQGFWLNSLSSMFVFLDQRQETCVNRSFSLLLVETSEVKATNATTSPQQTGGDPTSVHCWKNLCVWVCKSSRACTFFSCFPASRWHRSVCIILKVTSKAVDIEMFSLRVCVCLCACAFSPTLRDLLLSLTTDSSCLHALCVVLFFWGGGEGQGVVVLACFCSSVSFFSLYINYFNYLWIKVKQELRITWRRTLSPADGRR